MLWFKKKCKRCNNVLRKDSAFCHSCGARIFVGGRFSPLRYAKAAPIRFDGSMTGKQAAREIATDLANGIIKSYGFDILGSVVQQSNGKWRPAMIGEDSKFTAIRQRSSGSIEFI